MHRRFARSLPFVVLLVVLSSCAGPPRSGAVPAATPVGTPTSEPVTRAIGIAGGTFVSADGRIRIEVPAGAAADTTFSVQAITAHAPGGIGAAYRLGPGGSTFAVPLRLVFSFDEDDLAGTAPELLRIATQDEHGRWRVHQDVDLDVASSTVSVYATHFSDWSLVTGAMLSPSSATVRTGRSVELQVVVCEYVDTGELLAPLAAECRPTALLESVVDDWSVNGVVGGDEGAGTVAAAGAHATYTAPADVPSANPVAVSAGYLSLLGDARVLLVSNVTVVPSGCAGATPLDPCVFRLGEFDGQPLPYDGLPREAWQSPEIVTGGSLTIDDFDGDGSGTWAIEWEYTERRTASDLEHVVRIAGTFEPTPDGATRFTTLDDRSFVGSISASGGSVSGVPFYTGNTTHDASMRFVR